MKVTGNKYIIFNIGRFWKNFNISYGGVIFLRNTGEDTAGSLHITKPTRNKIITKILKNYDLYLLILPTVIYYIVFYYVPMYGVQLGFKDFNPNKGIWGSPWVGLKHFKRFFDSYYAGTLIKNTLGISFYALIAGFPFPILLALMLNEVRNSKFKKIVQTVTYAPYFISTVVMVGMILLFLSPRTGVFNIILQHFGFEPIDFMNRSGYFKSIYVWSGIWQSTGWSSIIYIAALTSIDPQQYDAAVIDGASRLQRIWHINIPGIMPTAVILLILSAGGIMSVGFEKIYLMQNPLNMETSDVIATYIYRSGIQQAELSFATSVGLFNSIINLVLLVIVNTVARKIGDTSLW